MRSTDPYCPPQRRRWLLRYPLAFAAVVGLLLWIIAVGQAQSPSRVYLPLVIRTAPPVQLDLSSADPRLPANGVSTTAISVTVRDGYNQPRVGIPVRLTTTRGVFANQDTTLEQRSDATGTVSTILQASLEITPDAAFITAHVEFEQQVFSEQTRVQLLVPERVTITSLPVELPADVRRQSLLVVQVQDASGTPIGSYPVVLSTVLGRFATGEKFAEVTTNATGRATVPFYATPDLGIAQVQSQAGQALGTGAVQLVLAQCNDFEDNDVPNQANEQPSAYCLGSFEDDEIIDPNEGEDDYYLIYLDPNQAVQVNLDAIPAGADYDLILYNNRLRIVAFSNQVGQMPEQLKHTHTAAEREFYYLRVNMYRKSSTAENLYHLRVALNPLEQPGSVIQRNIDVNALSADDPALPPKE